MKIIVQNLAIEYRDEGAGSAVLFLHGWQDDLRTFDALAALLSPTHRIIRVDLPGFGQGEMPRKKNEKEGWGIDNYARFVKDFIQKINVPPDAIIGHSFGGRIVIKGIATNMFAARKIILIASAGVAPRRAARAAAIKILAGIGKIATSVPPLIFWREKIRKRFYRFIGSDYGDAGALRRTFVKIVSEDLAIYAEKITVPTLIIWGDADNETPLSDGERLSRLMRNATLKIINGAGHFVHREKPQEVARLIAEFLR